MLAALKAQPDSPVRIADPQVIERLYRYWRVRILGTSIFGYALFYFVRANLSVPLKTMGDELGYSKQQLGLIITASGITYGISKFINGLIGDRSNPRYFMAIGLLLSAIINVWFGLSSALWLLLMIWVLNNWVQGMGFPPCARNMGYWFSPKERGTTFGIWHTSHMIGGALILALTGYLVKYYGWRSCFFVPAGIAAIGSIVVAIFLRDTPGSLGLPPVEVYKNEESESALRAELDVEESYLQVVTRYVLTNPYMWIISVANLLVYVLRDVQLKWGPTLLQENKHMTIVTSGWLGFGSELAGLCGALVGGIAADRIFKGRAGRVCVIAMALMIGVVYAFWKTPIHRPVVSTILFFALGFLLYMPQMLIAAMAMNLGTKRVAAAAVGLTGILGYLSNLISGWWLGHMVDVRGWDSAFVLMMICAAGTMLLMATTWNIGAHVHRPRREGFEILPITGTEVPSS
jgi:OPA family glycerol-3-phosphate transporter-like MFS transporter/OPA family sugar phosphate sensor protein UhpC-like MFS transporter